jgi:hypothetical protein
LKKIIIGIHGLGNKPSEVLLKKWWRNSICEGLKAITEPNIFYDFEIVYWAKFLHPNPLNPKINDKENPLHIDEPYFPAKNYIKKEPSELRKKVLDYIEKQMDKLLLNEDKSINLSAVTDLIIHRYFRDLELYYSSTCINKDQKECLVRDILRNTLAQTIEKHQDKEIMLIAHSMGSIIAYDVLTQTIPNLFIDTFVTIGSPLGLPIVVSKIISEQKKKLHKSKSIKTPENVRRAWYNFSDLEDKVAIDYSLAGDYEVNSRNIGVKDKIVYNNYEVNGERNPHKAYGYLRTSEIAEMITDFLNRHKPKYKIWLNKNLSRIWTAKLTKIKFNKE